MSFHLFKQKEIDYEEGSVVTEQEIDKIHPDFKSLVWIADGPKQNFDFQPYIVCADVSGFEFEVGISGLEQSLIFTGLPLEGVEDDTPINMINDKFYVELAPQERKMFLSVLQSPYDQRVPLAYGYMLLHGLERHLLTGDCDAAAKAVMWLRGMYGEKKFQNCSANGMWMAALIRNRKEVAEQVYDNMKVDFYYQYSPDLYMLAMYGLDVPMTAKRLMVLFKCYGFEYFDSVHLRNLRHFPEVYEPILEKEFRNRFGSDELLLRELLTKEEFLRLPRVSVEVFSARSIAEQTIPIPQMTKSSAANTLKALIEDCNEITNEARHKMYEKMGLRPEVRAMMKGERHV